MPVQQRIRLCLLLEKMYDKKEFSEKLGLKEKLQNFSSNLLTT